MKLGDLFTKLWFCTVPDPEYKCNPEYPCLDVTPVCGFRWQASFIPEDFERIQDFELVTPEHLAEMKGLINQITEELAKAKTTPEKMAEKKRNLKDAVADEILADTNMDAGLRAILKEGK